MSDKPEINTNVRLFDLVRFMRVELHEQGLITDSEYGWLCSSEMAIDPKGGSPSPRCLEDYDEIHKDRQRLDFVEKDAAVRVVTFQLHSPNNFMMHRNGIGFVDGDGSLGFPSVRALIDQAISQSK